MYIFNNLVYCPECREYCIKESAYKTSRDKKSKKLYLYYKCPICKKRINQDKITNTVAVCIENKKLPEDKLKAIEQLYFKRNKMDKRLSYLDLDFDDGFLNEKMYRQRYRKVLNDIHTIDDEISKIENPKIIHFTKLSNYEKRAIATQHIKKIEVDFKKKEKEVSNIVLMPEHNLISIFDKNVENHFV